MRYGNRSIIIDIAIIILVPLVFSTALGIYGAIRPKKIVSVAVPEHYGMIYENVTMGTEDGIRLAGWYIPKNGEKTNKAIIILHGYPTDKGDLLARAMFLSEQYNLLFLDFRYFGQSSGNYTTLGAKEVADLTAGIEYLQSIGMEKIGIYGFSMGGAVALLGVEALPDKIDAVAAEASYGNLVMMSKEMYRYLGPLEKPLTWTTKLVSRVVLGIDMENISPAMAVADSKMPILLIHSKEDKVIRFENALLIQQSLIDNPNAEYLFFSRGNHGEVSAEFAQTMIDFFAKNL